MTSNFLVPFKNQVSTFKDFYDFEKDMLDVFDNLFYTKTPSIMEFSGNYPKINIVEKPKEVVITAATSGLTKEDIDVSYKNGLISIKGKTKQEEEKEGSRYICREIKRSSFARSISINETLLDVDKIESSYQNGELKISIPKKEEAVEKKIEISG